MNASKQKHSQPQQEAALGQMLEKGMDWFHSMGWEPFAFQKEAWQCYLEGKSGLVNAPTGSGKTYSLLMPILLEYMGNQEKGSASSKGLQAIWVTPIRALAKEIQLASERAVQGLGLGWEVAARTGDTSTKEKQRQKAKMPELLITTPESLHILFAQKGHAKYFRNLKAVVVDEWHELLSSKRGVLMELALSRLRGLSPSMRTWGISATIGNLEEGMRVLLGSSVPEGQARIIRASIEKRIVVESIVPDSIEELPWAGHLGIKMLEKVVPILRQSGSTLIFANTRSQAEIWYQRLLDAMPELIGQIAMHHSSVGQDLRSWVEDSLHSGLLKAVVCTSSLDLGVDFRPVETIIQVGSPKGVSRFMQRAGRSGHRPGALSKIYFVPTHSLELIEAAGLRHAIEQRIVEDRIPYIRCFDVLMQYMLTLAVSDGFEEKELFEAVRKTHCYQSLSEEEWYWLLSFIVTGGQSLNAYDEYQKLIIEDGLYKMVDRRMARRHRLSIGTIVSDQNLTVAWVSGGKVGSIEEVFISKLNPGDTFWLAGRALELVRIKGMTVQVRKSKSKKGLFPAWGGGRMPLSSQMSAALRYKMGECLEPGPTEPELRKLKPLMEIQERHSHVPAQDEFLIEYFETKDGHHAIFYPFEGRYVHEGMGALLAYRISHIQPVSFSIAMNDYGFELLSDSEIPLQIALDSDIFSMEHLDEDIMKSINATEMARRKFRDIASISGLVFRGYPGYYQKDRHLQSSAGLFFDVFRQYDEDNLLMKQAYEEVTYFQLEETRLREALARINTQKIVLKKPKQPTPFAFPIMVDRLREKMTTEKLEDRIRKMEQQYAG